VDAALGDTELLETITTCIEILPGERESYSETATKLHAGIFGGTCSICPNQGLYGRRLTEIFPGPQLKPILGVHGVQGRPKEGIVHEIIQRACRAPCAFHRLSIEAVRPSRAAVNLVVTTSHRSIKSSKPFSSASYTVVPSIAETLSDVASGLGYRACTYRKSGSSDSS
jgi:hypothetical protein